MRRLFLSLCFCCITCAIEAQTGWFIPSDRFSSGLINDVCQDGDGFIWVATDYGLNKFDGYRFTTYLHHRGDSTMLSSNIVGTLYCDNRGRLWVGTAKGLDRYEKSTGLFSHYAFADGATPRVTEIRQLTDGRLYVGTSGFHGNYVLDGDSLRHWDEGDTSMRFVNRVMTDRQGRFWQCAFGDEFTMKDAKGLHRMKSTQGFVINFAQRGDEILIICMSGIHSYRDGQLTVADIDMSDVKPDAMFRSVCTDKQGNIWLGTRGDGLFRIAHNSRKLERVEDRVTGIDLSTAKIWAISEDHQGNIWLGCTSKGLLMLQKQPSPFLSWSFAAQGFNISSTVTSVCEGDNGMTWCTVQGNGVYGFDQEGRIVAHPSTPPSVECIYRDVKGNYWLGTANNLYAYDPLTGKSQLQATFDCDKFHCMVGDSLGILYISTFSRGFCIYDPATQELRNFRSEMKDKKRGWLCNNWVMGMTFDHAGRLWLATSSGVSCYDPKTESFNTLQIHDLLDNVLCYSLCETHDGNMMIATSEGLYVWHPGSLQAEPFAGGLPDKVVGYVAEAKNGDLWCATPMGIWQYDCKKQQFIGHVNGNGLTTREYINGVGMITHNGNFCFANNEGLIVFRPEEVKGSHMSMPKVVLTNFLVAGKSMLPDKDSNYFCISYLDNTLVLEFSLLDFNNPGSIVYEYRIGGGEWVVNDEGQNSIQLSRLQPDTYQIDVRAMSSGIYSPITTLTIEVTPPWYRSTTAYILYIIALLGIIVLMGVMWRRRTRRHLDEEKMKFLINATHDIRSPLTLIMAGIKKLKGITDNISTQNPQSTTLSDNSVSDAVSTIDRNAQRLMLLVNQILDERRIDKNQMQLHCRETNLVNFITGICKLYQYNANQRNIIFTFEHDKDHVLAWIDRINFDKVISNLLSNAFKYTYDGGEVKVVLRMLERDIEIQVIDNGMGIKEEDKDRLFDRFYQGHNADSMGIQGTGIGLNLSRNIVKMHGGQIKAQNRPDGESGTCFTVTIPKGNSHLKPEQIVTESPAREVLSSGGKQPHRQFRILIADDDPEIANYIISELGDKYKFEHVPNGKEALKALLLGQYELVISDVMMPEMDGITLLKRIKENPNISQLPVIMLTSKAEVEHKLEGLKSGADAYIAKPFNMDELHIQIDNLIDNVRRLRGKFSGALRQEERIENIEVKGNDDALMERIMRSVNANMSDPAYTVDALASDIGLSRAQLHRKMKEITGVSSGRFLRNLRMEQAARLLREGKVNVSQVADSVGYVDQAHFSTAFKAHFGMSPSEYMDSQRNS